MPQRSREAAEVDVARHWPKTTRSVDGDPGRRPGSARDAYRRVLTPRLTSSSSSWSNVSGFQLVAPDATASSSASFDG